MNVEFSVLAAPHTLEWALVKLRDGHKVCRKSWSNANGFLYLENDVIKYSTPGCTGYQFNMQLKEYFPQTNDWEVWEKPGVYFKDLKPGDKFKCLVPLVPGVTYQKLEQVYPGGYSSIFNGRNGPALSKISDNMEVEKCV